LHWKVLAQGYVTCQRVEMCFCSCQNLMPPYFFFRNI
jgi:hypothetical protein